MFLAYFGGSKHLLSSCLDVTRVLSHDSPDRCTEQLQLHDNYELHVKKKKEAGSGKRWSQSFLSMDV